MSPGAVLILLWHDSRCEQKQVVRAALGLPLPGLSGRTAASISEGSCSQVCVRVRGGEWRGQVVARGLLEGQPRRGAERCAVSRTQGPVSPPQPACWASGVLAVRPCRRWAAGKAASACRPGPGWTRRGEGHEGREEHGHGEEQGPGEELGRREEHWRGEEH